VASSGPEPRPYSWKINPVQVDSAPILDDEEHSGEISKTISS